MSTLLESLLAAKQGSLDELIKQVVATQLEGDAKERQVVNAALEEMVLTDNIKNYRGAADAYMHLQWLAEKAGVPMATRERIMPFPSFPASNTSINVAQAPEPQTKIQESLAKKLAPWLTALVIGGGAAGYSLYNNDQPQTPNDGQASITVED